MKSFYIDSGHFKQVDWSRNKGESQVFQKLLFSRKIAFGRSPDSTFGKKYSELDFGKAELAETR